MNQWMVRLWSWGVERLRPRLGWVTFLACLALVWLLVAGVNGARWVNVQRLGVRLDVAGSGGLLVSWLLMAWWLRGQGHRPTWVRTGLAGLIWLLAGAGLIVQSLVSWLPGLGDLWRAGVSREWGQLLWDVQAAWGGLGWRLGSWFSGALAGGAAQDDLVFLAWMGLLIWLVASLTAFLALSGRPGLLTALPVLWSLTTILYYGRGDRILLILALTFTLFLHLWLDQRRLEGTWQIKGIDFSSDLWIDRGVSVAGLGLMTLLLAVVLPLLPLAPLASWSYQALRPIHEPITVFTERLFPDLDASGWGSVGRLGGGLPNRFLLGSGPNLAETPVAWVRTSLSSPHPDQPPPGLYLRRGTFSDYTGRGWANPTSLDLQEQAGGEGLDAEAWPPLADRALVMQQIRTAQPSDLLLSTGEPVEPGLDYRAALRGPGDLVGLWSGEGAVDRYQVRAAVPAVDEADLSALGLPDPASLPDWAARHLALPDGLDPRIPALAQEVTQSAQSAHAQALALEAYLRTFTYDLDVAEPPPGADVAAYFLFDLQRGYCDYYATAFVVMARSLGIPARFATGYASGSWLSMGQEWLITEADAHAWPEVYFPGYGWIGFEPTAGRPTLDRLPPVRSLEPGMAQAPLPPLPPAEPEAPGIPWNWQMLLWLIPLAGLLIPLARWILRRREMEPWPGLLAWGRRAGHPAGVGETEREYGARLAGVVDASGLAAEERRRLARHLTGLGEAIATAHYAGEPGRVEGAQRARALWRLVRARRLRG
jgi:transglutaminase-like putative cysteine protease